jgi:transcriptional regulator with XRE-family HTH domain
LEIAMDYYELIDKALDGRTVSAVAREWGVPQPTLYKWVKGERMPDYNTGLRIARDAGIDPAEAFEVFAAEERNHKVKNFKLQMGFVQIDLLLFIATGGLYGVFYIMSNCIMKVCALTRTISAWLKRTFCPATLTSTAS